MKQTPPGFVELWAATGNRASGSPPRRASDALRHYARLARLRFEGGYTRYLEALDAERSLFNAELSHAQTQNDLIEALINTYKAMGGGWVTEADKLAGGSPRRGGMPRR